MNTELLIKKLNEKGIPYELTESGELDFESLNESISYFLYELVEEHQIRKIKIGENEILHIITEDELIDVLYKNRTELLGINWKGCSRTDIYDEFHNNLCGDENLIKDLIEKCIKENYNPTDKVMHINDIFDNKDILCNFIMYDDNILENWI